MLIDIPKLNVAVQVSPEDEELGNINWGMSNGYICYRISRLDHNGMLYMHRKIMERVLGRNLGSKEFVDHISGDRLDNRRSNLRLAMPIQNSWNKPLNPKSKSGFVGVNRCTHSSHNRWAAVAKVSGISVRLGCYDDPVEAAWMRDQIVISLCGEFAKTNLEYKSLTLC